MSVVIYKSNLQEFLKEASFAVYAMVTTQSSNAHYQTVKIVLSAWNDEDQPIQLHIDVEQIVHGDTHNFKLATDQAYKKLEEFKAEIKKANLEVRDGIFGNIDKPVFGATL